jgi:hypothetical protein
MGVLSTWSASTLLAILAAYAILGVSALVAPLMAPLLREYWRARRAGRDPEFAVIQPYPAYLLRHRRVWLFLLLVPPTLLVAVWLWQRIV